MFRTIASFVWQKDNTKKSVKSSIFVSFWGFCPFGRNGVKQKNSPLSKRF